MFGHEEISTVIQLILFPFCYIHIDKKILIAITLLFYSSLFSYFYEEEELQAEYSCQCSVKIIERKITLESSWRHFKNMK